MLIITAALPPEQVAMVGLNDRQCCDLFLEALAHQIGELARDRDPEFLRVARDFSTGKHVAFVTMHCEPALIQGPKRVT